jgi:hypothetical protein
MCGPGCTPWNWVCGDESVHTLCWNHDRAVCPTNTWYEELTYPACEVEYGAYSTWIFTDAEALGFCENDWVSDIGTEPWAGLSTNHPDYYDYDPAN